MTMHIRFFRGDITETKADVCVSSLHKSKDMTKGRLARAFLKKGGPSVQEALNAMGRRELRLGEVVTSPPGNLNHFTVIMFVCLLRWRDGNEKVLFKSVVECLQLAAQKKLRSIVFPALGMGGLHYPPFDVAKELMLGIVEYARTTTETSLETVYIALHDPNLDSERTFVQTAQAFTLGMQAEMHLARAGRGQESWINVFGREALDDLASTRPEESSRRPGHGSERDKFYSIDITPGLSLMEGTASVGVNVIVSIPGALMKVYDMTKAKLKSVLL